MERPKLLLSIVENLSPKESVIIVPRFLKTLFVFFVAQVCLSMLSQDLQRPEVIGAIADIKTGFCTSVDSCKREYLMHETEIVIFQNVKACLNIAMPIFVVIKCRP